MSEKIKGSSQESSDAAVCPGRPDSPHSAGSGLDPAQWEVSVRVCGENILTIGSHGYLCGYSEIDEYGDAVRAAGNHLLSFIGTGEIPPCFACDGSGEERWVGYGGAEEVGPCSVCQPQTFVCPVCGGNNDDRQLMYEACGGVGLLGDPAENGASGAAGEAEAALSATDGLKNEGSHAQEIMGDDR